MGQARARDQKGVLGGKRYGGITIQDIREPRFKLRPGTAVGIDQWCPYNWKQISYEAKEAIVLLLNHLEKHGVWPGYLYYNIIVHMGKPAGGSGTIALMPLPYRLWTKIRRPYTIKWETAHHEMQQ